MVDAVLLPFGNKIIFDSLLNSYPVRFGSGIRKGLNNQLRHAQELRGVVTSLEATDQTQAIINGNQKILVAFYKWLAKEGLSEKMQHEHHANIRIFVDDRLSSAIPPRSLLSVKVADLEAYFSACDNKANRVSFKRLVKFLCDSDRIGWKETERMEKFLKLQWVHLAYNRAKHQALATKLQTSGSDCYLLFASSKKPISIPVIQIWNIFNEITVATRPLCVVLNYV